MFRKKKVSVVTQAGEAFRERISSGDELLSQNDAGTIAWHYEEVDCQVVLPLPDTQGVGVFQTTQPIEDGEGMLKINRYLFTATGLLRATTVLLNRDEYDAIDEDTFIELENLSDNGEVTDEDQANFFTMFFSPFRASEGE